MSKDLRMEVFSSKEKISPVKLYVYQLHSQKLDNTFSIIRGAAWKIKNYFHIGVFEDGKYIYTTDKIDGAVPNADFTLESLGEKELLVTEHKKVYSELIKYEIRKKLESVMIMDKYRKYSCKSDVTTKWIMTAQGFEIINSKNKEISLERKYDFWITISDEGKAYLQINTGSVYSSNLNVYDYMERGEILIGTEVKNDWSINKQSGKLLEVCNYTVTDKLDFADSLKAYYENRNEAYRVRDLPNDTPVVLVELRNGSVLPYYPQALKPVLTREKVGQVDSAFSAKLESYVKRDMLSRLTLDRDFITDIGVLEKIGGLEFSLETCPVEELGYTKGTVLPPILIGGGEKSIECGNEFRIFSAGFYRKPNKKIKIGYIYPKNTRDKMNAVVQAIYAFAALGKYHGVADQYTMRGLLDITPQPMIQEEYELGDITDYKRAAISLQKIEGIDIVIALVPDGMADEGSYNPFKTIWAKANIPSQMISMSTAELFENDSKNSNKTKYYLQNIVLGILGKTGGIPWIVKDMPGNVDCFVGLDVSTIAKGIHYPACSVVFDKFGRLLGFYKPTTPQQGEKISTKILQDIFDQVIFAYEDRFGEAPQNIVIHRDGFSNEDDSWYEKYFGAKEIEYSIIEIKKDNHTKLMLIDEDNRVLNPTMGYCIYNRNEGFLVTTNIEGKKGSPNPLSIVKKTGNIPMPQILTQILYLSQLHVGSTHKLRLPITTGYADKICKHKEYVPEGQMDDRLFFL